MRAMCVVKWQHERKEDQEGGGLRGGVRNRGVRGRGGWDIPCVDVLPELGCGVAVGPSGPERLVNAGPWNRRR